MEIVARVRLNQPILENKLGELYLICVNIVVPKNLFCNKTGSCKSQSCGTIIGTALSQDWNIIGTAFSQDWEIIGTALSQDWEIIGTVWSQDLKIIESTESLFWEKINGAYLSQYGE